MKSNPNLYDDYDDLKKWKTFIQPSIQEADLYSKEFKHIDFSGSYFLDIGFGSGALLGWAHQQGAIVSGVEIQEKLIKKARKAGIDVYKELKEVPSERYDIVTGFDLLEHLSLNEISLFMLNRKMWENSKVTIKLGEIAQCKLKLVPRCT